MEVKSAIAVAAVLAATSLGIPPATSAGPGGSDAALADALERVEVSLERGLAASSREGTPISAKYELLEDDDADELRISVYTTRGGSFAKVIIDCMTGKIAAVVPIAYGEELAAAERQSKAMAQAKRSLEAATVQAVSAHSGYRAMSARPDLQDGRPLAKVILVDGSVWKTVYETLD